MKYIAPKITAEQKRQLQAGTPVRQELVYDAFETRNPIETLYMIQKARDLDPDNVDALCFMAAHSLGLSTRFRY